MKGFEMPFREVCGKRLGLPVNSEVSGELWELRLDE